MNSNFILDMSFCEGCLFAENDADFPRPQNGAGVLFFRNASFSVT